ncbi:MAG: aminotransferase class I/II-fold pyridoxal phosphate-dependent enzyme [Methanomicrobiales archaeon]|nr:aminotransferase class I/II-fold pyridoxal phosphate-dependent enzyme [Methanomicrobiales archaeon]
MRQRGSARAREIPPSGIRKFFDLLLTMEDVVSLGVGEPDFETPWGVAEAGIYAIEQGHTSYTSNKGLLPLRQHVARDLRQRYGISYDPEEEIVITTGVSEAADIAIRALVDPGDEVLVAEPSYVSYAPCVTLAGGKPVPVACPEKDEFRLTPGALMEKVTRKSRVLVLNFPNNPTGGVMEGDAIEAIADVVVDHDLMVISDEVYSELTYEGTHVAVASHPELRDRTVTMNGFSKAYSMTGWRVGYLCAPKDIAELALKIHQYVMLCAPTMGQMAATEALKSGEEEKNAMVREYRQRRNFFVEGLNRIGLPCHLPKGAFYAFPSVAGTGLSDQEFAEDLLTEHQVAVVPGSVFGPSGRDHLRCAYAVSREDLGTALKRMEEFISGLGGA